MAIAEAMMKESKQAMSRHRQDGWDVVSAAATVKQPYTMVGGGKIYGNPVLESWGTPAHYREVRRKLLRSQAEADFEHALAHIRLLYPPDAEHLIWEERVRVLQAELKETKERLRIAEEMLKGSTPSIPLRPEWAKEDARIAREATLREQCRLDEPRLRESMRQNDPHGQYLEKERALAAEEEEEKAREKRRREEESDEYTSYSSEAEDEDEQQPPLRKKAKVNADSTVSPGEGKVACSECHKMYSRGTLRQHKYSAHSEKEHKCTVAHCGYSSKRKDAVRRHIDLVHAVVNT
jgi:hypothetical protein